jgi:catechol 2,3-dioxygenase-like lactoylglutathione lyase family enzyme
MILDHVGIPVTQLEKSKVFFGKALAPLGIEIVMEVDDAAGLGKDGRPEFWIGMHRSSAAVVPVHVAFTARSRADVDAFHRAALAAGGTSNGAPGIRAHYHPDYYGAFVLDPDGHNIEVVCHRPA